MSKLRQITQIKNNVDTEIYLISYGYPMTIILAPLTTNTSQKASCSIQAVIDKVGGYTYMDKKKIYVSSEEGTRIPQTHIIGFKVSDVVGDANFYISYSN